jgi:hypothetical protein
MKERIPMVALREKRTMAMIGHCVEYRTLRGKRDELGLALAPPDQELLEELEGFFRENCGAPESVPLFARREHVRRPVQLQIEFRRGDGSTTDGTISDLSGGGAYVETIQPLAPGQHTILRIFDAVAGREWRLGAAVAWTRWGAGMGVRFMGIPLEVRLGHRTAPPKSSRPLRHAA